jgi:putative FmdB family regulatory protein
MPTYEYLCDACGNRFEKFQSMTSAPIRQCPKCKKNKVRRLISAGAGLIFKGSGFYITDYRSEGYKEKAKAEASGGESKSSETSSAAADTKPADKGASTDAKPAAKTEAKPAPAAKTEPKPAPKPEAKRSSKKR